MTNSAAQRRIDNYKPSHCMLAAMILGGSFVPGPALANDLKNGDLLVGVASSGTRGLTGTLGGILLLRNGVTSTFCESVQNSFDPSAWDIPTGIIVDSEGRVVFLAPLIGVSGTNGLALLRCGGIGATAEKLAIFPSVTGLPAGTTSTGYPVPVAADGSIYANEVFRGVSGLHLTILKTASLTDLFAGVTQQDAYNMVGGDQGQNDANPIRYLVTDQKWEASTAVSGGGGCCAMNPTPNVSLPDVISHSGATYSLGDAFQKVQDPFRFEVSGTIAGTSFNFTLNLYESSNTLPFVRPWNEGTFTWDTSVPMIESGCNPPAPPPISSSMPVGPNGVFLPFGSNLGGVVFDEFTGYGLTVTTNIAYLLSPFMTNLEETLLDNPGEPSRYFQFSPLNCGAILPFIGFSPAMPFFDPATGFSNGTDQHPASSPNGIFGTQSTAGNVVQMVNSNHATVVASGLNYPFSIASYPNGYSAGPGGTIVLRVDSPVSLLITDPNGKQLGVDSLGRTHNDLSGTNVNALTGGTQHFNGGFDSGPGEPRFFGIKNPVPGTYTVQSIGTGSGPYTVHVYSVNLSNPTGHAISTSGTASVGSIGSEDFTLATDGTIAFTSFVVPATEISATSSGLLYSRVTKMYTGTVTIKNIGTGVINGPLEIAVTSLSSGVAVVNATGTYNGNPYIEVPSVTSLSPGQSATVSVQFSDPSGARITFTPVIYSGSLT